MSILLSALNKSRDSNSSDELDRLLDSYVESVEEDPLEKYALEKESLKKEPIFSILGRPNVLLLLLAFISLLLLVIVFLLAVNIFRSEPSSNAIESQTATSGLTTIEARDKNVPLLNDQQRSISSTVSESQNTHQKSYLENYRLPEKDARKTAKTNPAADQQIGKQIEPKRQTASQSMVAEDLVLREEYQLSEVEKLMLNEVSIDAHVYSDDATQRFVFVDGTMKQEGQVLINSWVLESIEPNAVIVNNGALRVRKTIN